MTIFVNYETILVILLEYLSIYDDILSIKKLHLIHI